MCAPFNVHRCAVNQSNNQSKSINRSSQTLVDHKHPEQVMLDYELAKLYKATEGGLLRSVVDDGERRAPLANGRAEAESRRARAATNDSYYEVTRESSPEIILFLGDLMLTKSGVILQRRPTRRS